MSEEPKSYPHVTNSLKSTTIVMQAAAAITAKAAPLMGQDHPMFNDAMVLALAHNMMAQNLILLNIATILNGGCGPNVKASTDDEPGNSDVSAWLRKMGFKEQGNEN